MAELKQIIKDLEFQQNYVGNMFLKPPENNFSRVNLFGEISQLSEFTADSLYLFYEFILPVGWKIDNENSYSLIYKHEKIKQENLNRLKSISQTSTGYINDKSFSFFKSKEYSFFRGNDIKNLETLTHNFSLPFELELLGHNSILNTITPKLLIQINSVDWWERHRIEGYSYINIPIKTGHISLDLPCFKPKEDTYMKIFSYFLGGSRKIPELRELFKTASSNELNIDTVLNKYGIKTEYAGNLHLNLNVVIQNKDVMEKARNEVKRMQPISDFNLTYGIKQALGEEMTMTHELNSGGAFIQTSQHGIINRFTSGT
jgi:hypothetical protein